ncbi:MAG: hypothetical protein ACOVP1_08905 [Bacteroidia bacterium]
MARYVRIKRSKNLRFKLISLMYLIFLVLSIVQIPSDWLKVNQHMRAYINRPEGNFEDAGLDELSNRFSLIYNEFIKKIELDPTTGKLKESNSFNKNDEFFIGSEYGKELFQVFVDLKKWAQLLPENDESKQLFYDLFKEDLANGIEKEESNQWINWRWKHIPVSLSLNLMEEIKLRLKLLSQFEKKLDNNRNRSAFRIRTNQSKMKVGDQAELLLHGDSIQQVRITRNNNLVNEYEMHGDTLLFSPAYAGLYQINIVGNNAIENLEVDVKPRPFGKNNQKVLKVVYQGVKYTDIVAGLKSNMKLEHDQTCRANLNYEAGLISFVPEKEGWIRFKIGDINGLYCFDSVFVKALPKPILYVKDISGNTLSKRRFNKTGELELEAFHPSFGNGVFEIKSFKVKWVGIGSRVESVSGSKLKVSPEEIQKMQYLILHQIEYKAGNEIFKKDQPIIIQII